MAKIMLVEDDTNLSEIYQARLTAEGYEIVSAHDGEEALALAAKEKPDLIISDVMMPKISGFEMLDILRNTEGLRETKVIMLTALGQAEDKTRAQGLGADRYLVKSQVTLEDIVKAAQELLEGTNTTASVPQVTAPTATTPPPAVTPTALPVAQPVAITPAPAPVPVAPTPIVVAVPPTPEPAATPAPVAPTPPADPTAAADNKLVADAVGSLIGDTTDPTTSALTPTAPTLTTTENTPPETESTSTTSSSDDNIPRPRKKVIQPLSDDSVVPKPSLESLLENEKRKDLGAIDPNNPPAPTSSGNTPVTEVPHQPGHIVTPSASDSLNAGHGIDPNSIAL